MVTSPQQRELPLGEMISAFRIERTLGIGGFGITYLAFDTSLNIQVALKEYFPQNAWRDTNSRMVHCYAGEAEQIFQIGLQRFHKEGQILAQFKHPNIVGVRQMLPANNTAYLVMDYEHGEELEAYLRRLGRPLTYQEVENTFNPLLDGLRTVHDRGLLHLDIKPENIFLRADSTPVLIDFGGARHQLGQASRVVSFLVASDGYAPNEQYTGMQLQPTTDIYAIGATICRSITGKVPADAPKRGVAMIDGSPDPLPPIRQLVSYGAYPDHFLQTVDDALNMRVSNRPQSVRELQQRLFQAIPGASQSQQQQHPQAVYVPPTIPIGKKTNWLPIVAGGIAVLAAVLFWNSTRNNAAAELEKLRLENRGLAKQLSDVVPSPAVAEQPRPSRQEVVANTLAQDAANIDGEKVYKGICFACHDIGVAGSPKLGDKADWKPRIVKGKDALYGSAINGRVNITPGKVMPAKGGNAALSDAEVAAAVDWMVSRATTLTETPPSISSAHDETAVLALINDYAVISGQNDPYAALRFYTDPTDYYNKKSADYDFIASESKRYAGVYTARSFQVVSSPVLDWRSDDEVQATFKMSYTVCCKKAQEPASGVNQMDMRLVRVSGEWKIAAVSSKKI